MKYFNGFSLKNEEKLFESILIDNNFCVSGFSYGAIKALKYCINCNTRVDRLQLISPAFFNNNTMSFKKLQLIHFKKNSDKYIKNFINNSSYPSNHNLDSFLSVGSYDELDELLNYIWDKNDLINLIEKNVKIEVYLGAKDKIINVTTTLDFFKPYATVYVNNNFGHIFANITQNKQ